MDTATPKSALATECVKQFRVPLVKHLHLIQKDIAGFNIQTFRSSEHVANLITLPKNN
jgi:hypothetical protein